MGRTDFRDRDQPVGTSNLESRVGRFVWQRHFRCIHAGSSDFRDDTVAVTTEQQASNRPRAKAAFWFIGVVAFAGAAWLLSEFSQYRIGEVGTWPVSPASSDHPIANTFGELVAYRSRDETTETIYGPFRKLHEGVDILAIPHGDPFPSEIIVTAEGTISILDVNPDDNYNQVVILATDGTHQYTYMHLEHPPPVTLVAAENNGATVYPHEIVGTIRKAFPCGYNHLHYGVTKIVGGTEKGINPLKKIFPKPDQISPEILSIHLARHSLTRWSTFGTVGNRTVVSGGVDIVAAVTDRDDAGSAALAVKTSDSTMSSGGHVPSRIPTAAGTILIATTRCSRARFLDRGTNYSASRIHGRQLKRSGPISRLGSGRKGIAQPAGVHTWS